jgi:hypothetical protein
MCVVILQSAASVFVLAALFVPHTSFAPGHGYELA